MTRPTPGGNGNEPRVVVITGASSGIGRATALALARSGDRVVAASRGKRALDALVDEAEGLPGAVAAMPTDVADEASVHRLAAAAEDRYGRIDAWVNNAGVSVYGRVEAVTAAEFDRVMRVNFLGHVHGIQASLPALRRAGGGSIVGVSSAEALRPAPLQGPYVASKWALRGLYEVLRIELAEAGDPVAVTTVLPAAIDTPFYASARVHTGGRKKPPPPVYAPELVAAAVAKATRSRDGGEVIVGDSGFALALGERFMPALSGAITALRRVGFDSQESGDPAPGEDNVDAPLDLAGSVRGGYSGRVLTHSPLTTVLGSRTRPGDLVLGVVRRLRG